MEKSKESPKRLGREGEEEKKWERIRGVIRRRRKGRGREIRGRMNGRKMENCLYSLLHDPDTGMPTTLDTMNANPTHPAGPRRHVSREEHRPGRPGLNPTLPSGSCEMGLQEVSRTRSASDRLCLWPHEHVRALVGAQHMVSTS